MGWKAAFLAAVIGLAASIFLRLNVHPAERSILIKTNKRQLLAVFCFTRLIIETKEQQNENQEKNENHFIITVEESSHGDPPL